MTGNSVSESYLQYQSQPLFRPLASGGSLRPLARHSTLSPASSGRATQRPRASHRIQGAVNNVADVWRWQGPARAALVHGTPNVTYYLPAAPPPGRAKATEGGGGVACENGEDNRTQLLLMISEDCAVKREHQ